ncbi:uncharacterized protein K441DRAFT_98473 [Cenococcum geophilum 1.58]|uniref:uncharacterized protein n=1 Tax=Cenococcum geophilum 1.58 TaxID=794803 RepID=UPI00358EACE5|nr:hypothetical protein K441DRAFT_98473 [Cenococcum geophilum 1.58]
MLNSVTRPSSALCLSAAGMASWDGTLPCLRVQSLQNHLSTLACSYSFCAASKISPDVRIPKPARATFSRLRTSRFHYYNLEDISLQ